MWFLAFRKSEANLGECEEHNNLQHCSNFTSHCLAFAVIIKRNSMGKENSLHMYTHLYIYIYIYTCICVYTQYVHGRDHNMTMTQQGYVYVVVKQVTNAHDQSGREARARHNDCVATMACLRNFVVRCSLFHMNVHR